MQSLALQIGEKVLVNMDKIENKIAASWYDTREGIIQEIGEFENTGIREFKPPTSGLGNDWMLILDDILAENPEF